MKNQLFYLILASFAIIACEKDPQPNACFSYSHTMSYVDGPIGFIDSVQFENCSTDATSYRWDFGDETTSTEENPLHIYQQNLPAIVSLTAFNGSNSDVLTDTIWDWAIVYKPNLYLYPTQTTSICINLDFPKGGQLVTSIPAYKNGWCITAEPNGKIDSSYDYLFYESAQPNIWQQEKGWCIAQNDLELFFTQNMQEQGFASNEIADFTDYWIPLLKEAPYYQIFPQYKETINRVIGVEFSINPDVFYRLFYVIKPIETSVPMAEPEERSFTRNGFTAVEWGVILE